MVSQDILSDASRLSPEALPELFSSPPPGYGQVAFYWWMGDRLDRQRMAWQLDQLADASISGLQVNYAHSCKGGLSWGLTYPSDPPLFSQAWWEFFDWFIGEAERRGMAVSLSDYTLGTPGNGWFVDEVIAKYPDLHGSVLWAEARETEPGQPVLLKLPHEPLCVKAYRLNARGEADGAAYDLTSAVRDGCWQWSAPDGRWRLVTVCRRRVTMSIDPMAPGVGARVIESFFQKFTDRYPSAAGRALNFFFSDELSFGVSGKLWTDRFAETFRQMKGYDVVPELPALFADIGPRTEKVRLDYFDVIVRLSEQNFFKPVFDWHEARGMTYGCDHGGRGREVVEFGDYFRTQRWNQGPGCDQPQLQSDVIKNKVASSIAHLYNRPRTWLEGFYGSGWGTTSAQVVDATWRNFAMGHNLLTLHGLYYSTHGGWWEWAPPCNHFRMPYWKHLKTFLHASARASYLLSQGHHCCDVAVIYPVELVQATGDGQQAQVSFDCVKHCYEQQIDCDFIDAESLERASIEQGSLRAGDCRYSTLVLPSLSVMRHESLLKAQLFSRNGGLVIIVGQWPSITDHAGRDDPDVDVLVRNLRLSALHLQSAAELPAAIAARRPRDIHCQAVEPGKLFYQHRRAGSRDIYFVYGVPRGSECFFRAKGRLELWDVWTGHRSELAQVQETDTGTLVSMPLSENEPQVLVFQGDQQATACRVRTMPPKAWSLSLDGEWEFTLVPTLDNRWGDYRLPADSRWIGAEVRQLRCAPIGEDDIAFAACEFDDSLWQLSTLGFGPKLWVYGPVADDRQESHFCSMAKPDSGWKPYYFSWRFGVEDDPGPQGYHGLKGEVTDDFLTLGQRMQRDTAFVYEPEPGGRRYYVWSAFTLARPSVIQLVQGGLVATGIWRNGQPVSQDKTFELPAGTHRLLLRYDNIGRGYVVPMVFPRRAPEFRQSVPLSMQWYQNPDVIPFDAMPWVADRTQWYRCTVPPGLKSIRIAVFGDAHFWINGVEQRATSGASGSSAVGYTIALDAALERTGVLAIRVRHSTADYDAAAFAEPIFLDCETGLISPGDWSVIDGLACYSGGAWYRKTVTWPEIFRGAAVKLDLGDVAASAEVRVNGVCCGTRVAPPWTFDISSIAAEGENRIEVLVCNTLANHYRTIPTRYRGSPRSGLLGPVQVHIESPL